MTHADLRARAQVPRTRLFVFVLMLVINVVSVEAASLSVTWNAPATNADGTPLTDLASYRIYLATSSPACPGTPFRTVTAPTTTPTAGETVSTVVTGLIAGTTYFSRITAVDAAGNESTCSAAASAVAQGDFGVTPTTATSFGSVTTGTAVDRTFTVQNTSTGSISGTATVAAPFSVVSGGTFTLAAGVTQTVTVRFQPTTAGTFASNVIFAVGSDTVSRSVSGTGTASTTATLSVTKSGTGTGDVTSSPAGIACGATCSVSVTAGTQVTLTATSATGSTFTGWSGACTGTGACTLTVSASTTATATFVLAAQQAPVPVATSLSPATAVAGSSGLTITVNGSGFVGSSVARWDGASRATTFVSATQLRFDIAASDLTAARSVPVSVFTPAPGGGTSANLTFAISAPPPASGEIIIDNANAGVQDSAGGRTFTGRWCQSTATGQFGPSSLVSCGNRRDTYRWTPRIQVAGDYDVYVWWAVSTNRSTSVPITVVYAGGTNTRMFNERSGGGQWVLHGRYTFNAGTTGYVETSDATGSAGADAVRLVPATAQSSSAPPPPPPPPSGSPAAGLVAAYAFNEASGTSVTDLSGSSNTGTLGSGVTRTAQGRFGGALAFNGAHTLTVPHSASLNLTSAMTLEAWVFPTAAFTQWATVIMKERSGTFAYTLYAGSPTNRPNGYFNTGTTQGTEHGVAGPSALPVNVWSHLATTYDGMALRLYLNGVQIASAAYSGPIVTTTGALRIGGNDIWGEFFRGFIDEIRIYNRALAPGEIQADMNTPIGN
jgi:hypothetical protein